MKRNRHPDEQIISALKKHDSGMKVTDICREIVIVKHTHYKWKTKLNQIFGRPHVHLHGLN